jgi:hypothetical protein
MSKQQLTDLSEFLAKGGQIKEGAYHGPRKYEKSERLGYTATVGAKAANLRNQRYYVKKGY